jgi:hypothetical protein
MDLLLDECLAGRRTPDAASNEWPPYLWFQIVELL